MSNRNTVGCSRVEKKREEVEKSTSCLCGDCSRRISLLDPFLVLRWYRSHYHQECGRCRYYYSRGWLHLRKQFQMNLRYFETSMLSSASFR